MQDIAEIRQCTNPVVGNDEGKPIVGLLETDSYLVAARMLDGVFSISVNS